MASLLYQIKGPVNANNRNQVEVDSDNMLRPLMDFLDAKSVKLTSPYSICYDPNHSLICVDVFVCEQSDAICVGVWENGPEESSERAVEDRDEQPRENYHPSSRQRHICKIDRTSDLKGAVHLKI